MKVVLLILGTILTLIGFGIAAPTANPSLITSGVPTMAAGVGLLATAVFLPALKRRWNCLAFVWRAWTCVAAWGAFGLCLVIALADIGPNVPSWLGYAIMYLPLTPILFVTFRGLRERSLATFPIVVVILGIVLYYAISQNPRYLWNPLAIDLIFAYMIEGSLLGAGEGKMACMV